MRGSELRGSGLLARLLRLAGDSVADPRGGYRKVAALGLGADTLLMALGAISVLGVLMAEVVLRLVTDGELQPLFDMGGGPLLAAAMQFGLALLLALGIRWIGTAAGGTGSWAASLLAVTWLQFILLLLQVVQFAALFLLPPLAAILLLVGAGLTLWLLTGFIAELHGFPSRLKVFFGLLGCMFLAGMLLLPLLGSLGFIVPGLLDV